MCLGDEIVEVGQGPVHRIDSRVVGNVISEIVLGRGVVRRQPDGVHPEIDEVVEAGDDPGYVPNTVAVAVLKTPRIDLIDDSALPPERLSHIET